MRFTRLVVTVVLAMAIVLSAVAMHKTPAQLPSLTSEILTPVWRGEVLT